MKSLVTVLILVLAIGACSSKPVLPDKDTVKVSREEANQNCKDLGKVVGTTLSAKGTSEQALEDLKREAANKGANYVVVKQYSGTGTSVTGQAYDCP